VGRRHLDPHHPLGLRVAGPGQEVGREEPDTGCLLGTALEVAALHRAVAVHLGGVADPIAGRRTLDVGRAGVADAVAAADATEERESETSEADELHRGAW